MKFGRWELLWSVINFIVFAAVLTRLLYRPVLALLDDRARFVSEQRDRAERARAEAEQELRAAQARESEADQRAREIVATAAQRARAAEEHALARARAAAEQVVSEARARMANERQRALVDLRRETGELVVAAAQRVLMRNLDEGMQRELIGEAISALEMLQ